MSFAELTEALSGFPGGRDDPAIQIEPQQLAGKTVDHVNVLFAYRNAAGQAGILEFPDEFAALVEDLNSLILAVGHPQLAVGVDGDSVSHVESAGFRAPAAPALDKGSAFVELEYARITLVGRVSLDHKEVAVAADCEVIRFGEATRPGGFIPLAGLSPGAQTQQDLSLGAELDDDVRSHVGYPEIVFTIDPEAMSSREKTLPKGSEEFAVRVELHDRRGA